MNKAFDLYSKFHPLLPFCCAVFLFIHPFFSFLVPKKPPLPEKESTEMLCFFLGLFNRGLDRWFGGCFIRLIFFLFSFFPFPTLFNCSFVFLMRKTRFGTNWQWNLIWIRPVCIWYIKHHGISNGPTFLQKQNTTTNYSINSIKFDKFNLDSSLAFYQWVVGVFWVFEMAYWHIHWAINMMINKSLPLIIG